jgi:nucleoside-diphosphate-sugar epimerase
MAAPSRALPWVLVDDVASAILGALGRTACIGKTYNLVRDCRLSIDAYVSALNARTARKVVYHQRSPAKTYAVEKFKSQVKRLLGRPGVGPRLTDLKNRTMNASWDTAEARQDLNWQPVSDVGWILSEIIRVRRISPSANLSFRSG